MAKIKGDMETKEIINRVKIMESRLAKKITIIMSYDYDDNLVVSDDNIAYRIR